jgi:hypothetical protein
MLLLDNILFHFVISIICIYYEVYQQVKEDASFSKPASKKTQCNKRTYITLDKTEIFIFSFIEKNYNDFFLYFLFYYQKRIWTHSCSPYNTLRTSSMYLFLL